MAPILSSTDLWAIPSHSSVDYSGLGGGGGSYGDLANLYAGYGYGRPRPNSGSNTFAGGPSRFSKRSVIGNRVNEIGGLQGKSTGDKFLDETIPAGAKPTKSGEIATTNSNPSYGKYGMTRNGGHKAHYGVDYVGEVGDEVYAMYEGKVVRIWDSKWYGPNAIRIQTEINGISYYVDYGHLSGLCIDKSQLVGRGDIVGYMGRMGNLANTSFPTHVHIAVWRSTRQLNQGFVKPWWE